jgi:hypothetical protein
MGKPRGRKAAVSHKAENDRMNKELAFAMWQQLQNLGFKKSAKTLGEELEKLYGSTAGQVIAGKLVLQEITSDEKMTTRSESDRDSDEADTKVAAPKKAETETGDSSSSDSSSSGSDEEDEKVAAPKKAETSDSSGSSSSSSSSSSESDVKVTKDADESDSSSSSSDSDSDSDSGDPEPPKKRARKMSTAKVVTPEESDSDSDSDCISNSDSDTDVSDVEVSDVSSVEVTTSEEEDSSSDDSSEDESSDEEEDVATRLKAKKEEAARKAREANAAALNWTPSKKNNNVVEVKTERGSDGAQALSAGKPFQRVDDKYWGEVAMKDGGAIADNSYEGAFGSEGFGSRASEKLTQVRGKNFRHEKTKRKRTFNGFSKSGGAINMESFSTKYKCKFGIVLVNRVRARVLTVPLYSCRFG